MSSAGEHKMGKFSFYFLCKNNFMLFLPDINLRKIIGVMKYKVGAKLLTFQLSMFRAGEHQMGNFSSDFLYKNNFMLFLPDINLRKIIDVMKY